MIAVFDLLGTLVSPDRIAAAVGDPALVPAWSVETLRNAMALTLAGRYAPFAAVGEAAWRRLLRDRDDVDGAVERAVAAAAVLDAQPGAHECVRALDDRGLRLAALTNSSRSRGEDWLRAVGFHERVAPVVSADDVAAAKPHPTTYRRAAAVLGVAPHDLCLVSAHAWDVAGAAAAGLDTVWIGDVEGRWALPGEPPGRVAPSLADVPDVLGDATPTAPRPDAVPGLGQVIAALETEDFPMDRQGLFYAVGDLEVADLAGRRIPVRRLIDRMEQSRFRSAADVATSIRVALTAVVDRETAGPG